MCDYHLNIFSGEADAGYIADIPDLESSSVLHARGTGFQPVQIA